MSGERWTGEAEDFEGEGVGAGDCAAACTRVSGSRRHGVKRLHCRCMKGRGGVAGTRMEGGGSEIQYRDFSPLRLHLP